MIKSFSKNIKTISQMFFIIITYTASFMCFFVNDLISIKFFGFYIVGESFWESMIIVPWITFGYVFYGLYVLQSPSLYIKNKQNWTPVFWGAGTIVNIILNILLIPRLDILGAAIATFVSYLLIFVFIKVKNKSWMPLPILSLQVIFYVIFTSGALFFRYYNDNTLLISSSFLIYTIFTIYLLSFIKKTKQ